MKKNCWFNMQEKGKLPSLWLQGQLRIHHPPDKLRSWEDTDVLLKLWSWKKKPAKKPKQNNKKKKSPQKPNQHTSRCVFCFFSPIMPEEQCNNPTHRCTTLLMGVKNGVSTGELLTPAGTARVISNAKQHTPKSRKYRQKADLCR